MRRVFEYSIIAASIVFVAACATTQSKNYVICNDLDANVTCPDNTANIVVSM